MKWAVWWIFLAALLSSSVGYNIARNGFNFSAAVGIIGVIPLLVLAYFEAYYDF